MDAYETLRHQICGDCERLHHLIVVYARTGDQRIRWERDKLQEATEVKLAIIRRSLIR